MDLSGIVDFITNPAGALVGGVLSGAVGIISFQVYKIVKGIIKPAQYIDKLYSVADSVVVNIDDRLIDKYLPKAMKKDMTQSIIKVLEKRRGRINKLIDLISD